MAVSSRGLWRRQDNGFVGLGIRHRIDPILRGLDPGFDPSVLHEEVEQVASAE
jgi:hypothetical protein